MKNQDLSWDTIKADMGDFLRIKVSTFQLPRESEIEKLFNPDAKPQPLTKDQIAGYINAAVRIWIEDYITIYIPRPLEGKEIVELMRGAASMQESAERLKTNADFEKVFKEWEKGERDDQGLMVFIQTPQWGMNRIVNS